MRLSFEANFGEYLEETVDLDEEEIAAIRAAPNEEERRAVIRKIVREMAWYMRGDGEVELLDCYGFIQED